MMTGILHSASVLAALPQSCELWFASECLDINECTRQTALCNGTSSTCTNIIGGYTCGCNNTGYELGPNNFTCVGKLVVLHTTHTEHWLYVYRTAA